MDFKLKMIADELGISLSTVSRVLNGKPNVNDTTRQMVLDFLEKHDAMGMVTTRVNLDVENVMAVVIPDISENYFDYVVRGIENQLWTQGIGMMLCDTMEDVEKESSFMEMLIAKGFSGIVLATVDRDERRLSGYIERGVNVVFFDNLPNITKNYNSVITDNMKASVLAVNHLASLGHRRIGFISGKQYETTGFERLAGYRLAMERNRFAVEESLIAHGDFKEPSGFANMTRLLERNPDMSAVFVSSSQMTYGAMKAIRGRGLRVPEDISLIGFDVYDSSGLIRPGITSIIQDEERIGLLCVELILKNRRRAGASADMPCQRIQLDPRIVVRESCGVRKDKN